MHKHGRVPTVLLVEDDPGDVLMITEALERTPQPPRLQVAGDGEQALAILRRSAGQIGSTRPDLILMDLNMPRMDGREALALIKADESLRTIPVVVFTTSDAGVDVLDSYQSHANAFVTKPLDLAALEHAVEE